VSLILTLASKWGCDNVNQETKTIAQDESFPVDEDSTPPFHDFNPFS
jgi:hypothetical protein